VVCIEEFHAQFDDVLDQCNPEDGAGTEAASFAPAQRAKRDVINHIRRSLSQTLERKCGCCCCWWWWFCPASGRIYGLMNGWAWHDAVNDI